jgi:hypothetical protein
VVNTKTVSIEKTKTTWIFLLMALAALSLAFVWRGAGRMMGMQTRAESNAEFAQLKTQDDAKIAVEVKEVPEGRIRGRLLEKKDETHYVRTGSQAEISRGKDTTIVMGKEEDIRAGAVIHVTGKMGADRNVQATQIVVLTGYVQVR